MRVYFDRENAWLEVDWDFDCKDKPTEQENQSIRKIFADNGGWTYVRSTLNSVLARRPIEASLHSLREYNAWAADEVVRRLQAGNDYTIIALDDIVNGRGEEGTGWNPQWGDDPREG